MLKEIQEQPEVLEKTIKAETEKLKKLGAFLRGKDIDLIILVARGSSDNASLLGRYLLEITTGIPVSLSAPSVFTLYKAKLKLNRALVIGVSQSGEGADINQVLQSAKKSGAFTLGITNEADSSMAKIVDETLLIHAGREKSVAATKTYTGQMLHFYLLASVLAESKIKYEEIPSLCAEVLKLKPQVADLVQRYAFMENCVVVGRGLNYGNSYELALKLMETCYVVAERFSSADFFHGPLAIVERRFPVILFAPKGVSNKSNIDLARAIKRTSRRFFFDHERQKSNVQKFARSANAGNGRIFIADSVHYSGANVRRFARRGKRNKSRRAAFAVESYKNGLMRQF